LGYFKNDTYLASTPARYIVLIGKALSDNSPEKEQQRRWYANEHSWTNNVAEIYKYIALVSKEKGIAI